MMNIDEIIAGIRKALYGREVREYIASAIQWVKDWVTEQVEQMKNWIEWAKHYALDAQRSATASAKSAAESKESASQSAASAASSKASADASAASAAESKASAAASAKSAKNSKLSEESSKLYSERSRDIVNDFQNDYKGGYYKTFNLVAYRNKWGTLPQAQGIFTYYCDIPVEDLTERFTPFAAMTLESYASATAAGVACTVESRKGCLRLFSRRIPDADLDIILTLFGVGTLNYFLAVPTADWAPLRPTIGPNQYYCDVAVKNCTSDMIPLGMTDLVNWEEAENAGMASVLSTGDGYVRFYAVRRPEANIHANVILLKREEPVNRPATKTELGLVIVGDGLDVTSAGSVSTREATDAEFKTAMDAAFEGVEGWQM